MDAFAFVHFLDTWKRLIRINRRRFSSNVEYDAYLQRYREDFLKKWYEKFTSPETGLAGFREVCDLGCGSFGCVRVVKHEKTGQLYAAKILSKQKVYESRLVNNALREKQVLHSINFPNHTSLEFSRKDNDYLYLGMTLVKGGELFTLHRRFKRFSEIHANFYAAQVFLALEYMHSLHLIYRDLKPENICIDWNGYIKLTDYGFTKYVVSRTLTLCGTPEYLSPEVIKMKPYGTSADWWAFGILIYEFVAGRTPFATFKSTPLRMYERICDGKYKLPDDFSGQLKHLISSLLQTNVSKRLGVCKEGSRDIKNHIWFKKVNWYDMLNQNISPPYMPDQRDFEDITQKSKIKIYRNSDTNQYAEIFEEF